MSPRGGCADKNNGQPPGFYIFLKNGRRDLCQQYCREDSKCVGYSYKDRSWTEDDVRSRAVNHQQNG